jgi:hypothetical protein
VSDERALELFVVSAVAIVVDGRTSFVQTRVDPSVPIVAVAPPTRFRAESIVVSIGTRGPAVGIVRARRAIAAAAPVGPGISTTPSPGVVPGGVVGPRIVDISDLASVAAILVRVRVVG